MRRRPSKDKNPNNAKTRQLAEEWAALMEAHSTPLERGAKAKGVDTKTIKLKSKPLLDTRSARPVENPGLSINSVRMNGAATQPLKSKDMQEAIHKVSSRVGAAYNKGGLQYLTDDELAEHKTGAHKRR